MNDKSIKLARLLVTGPALFLAVVPPLVDFNSTHVTNPLWTGHARLHTVWLLTTNSIIAVLALGLMWRELKVSSIRAGAILTAAPLAGFFCRRGYATALRRFLDRPQRGRSGLRTPGCQPGGVQSLGSRAPRGGSSCLERRWLKRSSHGFSSSGMLSGFNQRAGSKKNELLCGGNQCLLI